MPKQLWIDDNPYLMNLMWIIGEDIWVIIKALRRIVSKLTGAGFYSVKVLWFIMVVPFRPSSLIARLNRLIDFLYYIAVGWLLKEV
jgi:hypothetical protein